MTTKDEEQTIEKSFSERLDNLERELEKQASYISSLEHFVNDQLEWFHD